MHAPTCNDRKNNKKTGSPALCFWEFLMLPWPATVASQVTTAFQPCKAKTTKERGSSWDDGCVTRKCSAALPQSVYNFISVTGHHKQLLPFLWTHKTRTHTHRHAKKCRKGYTVTKETSAMCAKPSLKLPPAESSALAEWTWFNPCISCHGFPFSPQLWRERSLHAE